MDQNFMEIRANVKDSEIIEKLDMLRLERGIPSNTFIIGAITEKLKRDGYLQDGVKKHVRKVVQKEQTPMDQLRNSFIGLPTHK